MGLDHLGAFGYGGDDWRVFDRRSFAVQRVIDGDTFVVWHGADEVTVGLLGVAAPQLPAAHWAENAKAYLSGRTLGKTVSLRLDTTRSRDERGRLLAYVYINDGDLLNADIIRDAQAFADRRVKHSMHGPFEQAENEARKKSRGMWKGMHDEEMPSWRREWLKSLRDAKRSP